MSACSTLSLTHNRVAILCCLRKPQETLKIFSGIDVTHSCVPDKSCLKIMGVKCYREEAPLFLLF